MRAARARLALVALALLLPGCILPSGYDARTNGGRYDPGPNDPYQSGPPGVVDMRSKSQNSWAIWLFGPPDGD